MKGTYFFLPVIFCCLLLYSCQSRYAYRQKVNVHPKETTHVKAAPDGSSQEEASTDISYQHILSHGTNVLCKDSIPISGITSTANKQNTMQNELVDSTNRQELANNRIALLNDPKKPAGKHPYRIGNILLLTGLGLALIGIWQDYQSLEGAGMSPFTYFGFLLIIIGVLVLVITSLIR